MNNIQVGANSRTAIVSADISTIGLTTDDIIIIFEAEGNYKSWAPGRDLNAITMIIEGNGYLISSKKALDLTAFFGLDAVSIGGVPIGGNPGQIVAKQGVDDLQCAWIDLPPNGEQGEPGEPGQGVPIGGGQDDVLVKTDATDYKTEWKALKGIPEGGTTSQVLAKSDDGDYNAEWIDNPGGGVSGLLDKQITFGKSDGSIEQSSDFQYDKTNKTLLLGTAPTSLTGNLYGWGDSITAGIPTPPGGSIYLELLGALLGLTVTNNGLSGSIIESQTPTPGSFGSTSMVELISSIPTKGPSDTLMTFCYGINDVHVNLTNYNPTNFKADYRLVLNAALAKGWLASEIVICSTTYANPSIYTDGAGGPGPAPSLQRHLDFNAATLVIANEYGCIYADVFNFVADRGGIDNLINLLHPNLYGHALMASCIYEAILGNVKSYYHTDYILPDGSKFLGISPDGRIGLMNSSAMPAKLKSPIISGPLVQEGTHWDDLIALGFGTNDIALGYQVKIWGYVQQYLSQNWIEVLSVDACMRFYISGTSAFKFIRPGATDLNDVIVNIDRFGRMAVGTTQAGAFAADPTGDGSVAPFTRPGDIGVHYYGGLTSHYDAVEARFVPFNANFDTEILNTLATGNIVLSVSGGVDANRLKAYKITPTGDFESLVTGNGIILKSPDGTKYKVTVANGGALTTTAV